MKKRGSREGAGDSDRATGRRHVPCIMKGGEERGPSLAVRPSIRSIVPFWNENEKRGKFRSFARKKYKVWHAPIDPFGGGNDGRTTTKIGMQDCVVQVAKSDGAALVPIAERLTPHFTAKKSTSQPDAEGDKQTISIK